ncbi:hypothetical protein BH23CHL8_BH23CHL8_16730 [soil metagenome]
MALGHAERRIWLAVTDPAATAQAREAGVGARVRLTIGPGAQGAHDAATQVDADVLALPDGRLSYVGPYARGVTRDMGETALLGIGQLRIVLHARQLMEIDPAPYIAAGLDPREAEVLQAKSHVSYRAGYAGVTDRSVVADMPGPTAADLMLLPNARRPRPLFPFEDPPGRDPTRSEDPR